MTFVPVKAAGETVIQVDTSMASGDNIEVQSLTGTGWGENGEGYGGISVGDVSRNGLPKNAAITINSGIPSGLYDVYYWIVGNHENQNKGRAGRILDQDLEIKDENGVHTVESIKPHFYYEGYVSVGRYSFSGDGSDYIKATVNEDNSVMRALNDHMILAAQKVKFVPVTDDYGALLSAVNGAATTDEMGETLRQHGGKLVDANALVYMEDVYSELLGHTYSSSYELKSAFDKSVEKRLKTVTYESSSFAWRINTDTGYRVNRANVQMAAKLSASAIVTFGGIDGESLKGLKLKPDATDIRTNVIVKSFSGAVYDAPSGNMDPNLKTTDFTELTNPVCMLNGATDLSEKQVLAAVSENGYISFYMEPETLNYNDENTAKVIYNPTAKLIATYDVSDVGGAAAFKGAFEDGKEILSGTRVSKDNKVLTLSAVEDFVSDDFISNISVTNKGEAVKFTAEKTDAKTLTITFSDGLEYDGAYKISSEKYIRFNGDEKRYLLDYSFVTEQFPIEFSGLTVKESGSVIENLDGIAGKSISVSAEIKNNTLGKTKLLLMVNLFDKTADGVKLISSAVKTGEISAGEALGISDKEFVVPADVTDCFMTVNIWDTFSDMNTVKMYNTASYEKFE